jgi:hypothetical protein
MDANFVAAVAVSTTKPAAMVVVAGNARKNLKNLLEDRR